jgi:hypothetical protein
MHLTRTTYVVAIAACVWAGMLAVGFAALANWENTPGAEAQAARTWPAGLPIAPAGKPTLVMIAHPLCSCTRASLVELAKVTAAAGDGLAALVIVDGTSAGAVEKTAAFRNASAIAGVRVIADRDGSLRRRFGAATSGQVFLYDDAGRLRFSGGITPARGVEGTNNGSAAIIAFARGRQLSRIATRVFGCALDARRNGKE